MPGFVLAFLALVVVRTVVSVPAVVLRIDNWAVTFLLGGALAALGLQTTLASFRAAGGRPLLLGLGAWLVALLVSLGLLVALEVDEGVARPGFEPGTPRFSVECSTGLSYPANAFQGYRTDAVVSRRTRTRP